MPTKPRLPRLAPISLWPLTPEQAIRRAMSASPLPLSKVKASKIKRAGKVARKAKKT